MKIRYIISRIVLLLFISTTVFAQSTVKILGVVTSKNTREPIPGVNIVVVGTGYGAASDISGRYQIENLLEGSYTIRAYFIGCKIAEKTDVRVPIDNSVRLNFQLEQDVIPLAAVEIAADRFDIGPDVSKITLKAETIAKSNAGSVGELLTEIPGVDIKTTGSAGTKTTISIRGSQSNQVLVLLDGIPLNNEQGGDADLAAIPVNIIEKIDVYKGGQSSRYGSGAIGGVIHIQTKSNFKNQLQLNSGAGAFGYLNVEPAWSGSYKRLTWFLSYQYSKSDGDYAYSYQDSKNESVTEERLNADFDSHNFYGRLNFQTGDHRFSIHGQQLLSDRGIPGAINGWTPYARATAVTSIAGAEYQYTRRTMNVTASYRFSNAFSEYKNRVPADAELKYRRYPPYSYDYETRNN
ncbi:TonB-dependent receptor plug domain-containing protein, partial [bacterium]|nr:TonB-dependent receptor plug domain-containing protein [bacterium]